MIQIRGLDEINEKLSTLTDRAAKKVIRQELRKAAKPLVEAVKSEAPEGETDQLKKKVKVRSGKRSRNKISMYVLTGYEDFEKFYSSFVQLGAISHPTPDPYMLRAVADVGNDVRDQAMQGILDGVIREAAS